MPKPIAMLDLHAEFAVFGEQIKAAVHRVLESQQFIGGPDIAELEKQVAAKLGIADAVAVSNGTDALLCALMALGIGHGDEVIVPTFTFFATAGCVHRVGAKPVFVDIDPKTFCMDAHRVRAAVTSRTKAIMPVHLYGQCADMDALRAIAREHRLVVIEDTAQAIGARQGDEVAGSMSDLGCLSFYPTKNLGGFGEGGMILSTNVDRANLCRRLRNHGQSQQYLHDVVGGNFRLDTLKAAILLVKLPHWEKFTQQRRESASMYDALLKGAPVTPPHLAPRNTHVYHQYTILCDRRDELMAFLKSRDILTAVYYPVPLHRQPCFAYLNCRCEDFPVAEDASLRVLSLPVHPMLTEEEINRVAGGIHDFYGTKPR
ncbi:MAG: DegT/DnrJ/EryC1/StrS family aminotransferase [Phycisphaerales bacterium]|nr:DegT/DnrJ/EryC1/StrS family aminotransferase [Phycisphaerales bacterium]